MKSNIYRAKRTFLRNAALVTGRFDIPVIKPQKINLDEIALIGFHNSYSDRKSNHEKIVHFFMDDYKFERVWHDPGKYIVQLSRYKAVCSPDFSIYSNMSRAIQIFNVFRRQWCGAFWQENGISVIPTVTWGDKTSFSFCFDGIEKGSTVAISTLGCRKIKDLYLDGYKKMLEVIQPTYILCYGSAFAEMQKQVIEIPYRSSFVYAGAKEAE